MTIAKIQLQVVVPPFGILLATKESTKYKCCSCGTACIRPRQPSPMADWKSGGAWGDDDGDGWEDVAAVAPKPQPSNANGDAKDSRPSDPSSPPVPATASGSEGALKASLSASERRVAALTKERDVLRRARDGKVSRVENAREKDRQIASVLEEGAKLSVKVADAETSARRAKVALREREGELERVRKEAAEGEARFEAAQAKMRMVETSERAALEGREAAERRLRQVESDVRTKSSSSAALEAARGQLEALRKSQAVALENLGMRLRAEAEEGLAEFKEKARAEEDSLNKAIGELRTHLTQVTENAGWKEDQLRKESAELRARAESLEERNEELASAVPGATRPLLRQVEALQAAASEKARAISAVEKSQMERLRAAEASVAASAERERAAETRIGSLLTKIAGLEEQLKIASAETSRLETEVRDVQGSVAVAELAHRRALDNVQVSVMKAVREKEALVDDLSKARAAHLDDSEASEDRERALREKSSGLETKLEAMTVAASGSMSGNQLFGASSPRGGLAFRTSESNTSFLQSPFPGDSASAAATRRQSGGALSDFLGGSGFDDDASVASFSESTSMPGGVYDTERLQSTLRQRLGEIQSLQSQLIGKEAATQALADEVVALTATVEQLTAELKDAPQLRAELIDLRVRHSTLLELLGEHEEKIQELEADIVDINQMYKQQITDLLLKLET